MRTLLILSLLLSYLDIFSQNAACLKFRNGNFQIKDEYGTTIINRKGNTQTEQMVGNKNKSKLKVTWINECTYELRPSKKTRKNSGNLIPANGFLTVTITEVKENSYIQTTKSNFSEVIYTSEVSMIE